MIIANGFEKNALKLFNSKKNLRLIDSSSFKLEENIKIISGLTLLIQTNDNKIFTKKILKLFQKLNPLKK